MTNGERTTIISAAADTANRLIVTLPAQFLCLLVINTGFLIGVLLFVLRMNQAHLGLEMQQIQAREHVLNPLIEACTRRKD